MGKINVLEKHVAELIAAGEVVERPSSVIKELLENAIDAGAKNVSVEIKNGGVTYMRVTDDGCGIMKEDIRKAFVKNATSKILRADDLDRICTLGFRGEALASVSAVARVELITRETTESDGSHYVIEGGEEVLLEDFGCSCGTTIIVRDLFYNVPARLKFLKKDVSEANAISKLIDRIAMSHPDVKFKLTRDGKETLNTPGDGTVESAIYAIYGKDFTESLMPIDYSLHNLTVNGFINKPNLSKPNRNMQHFFINGRYVKTKTAMAALEEAFKGAITVQKFPACVLYINIPFDTVDVNVHPSKMEVRFVDEKPIFQLVYHGVKSAILQHEQQKFAKISSSFNSILESQQPKIYSNNDLMIEKKLENFVHVDTQLQKNTVETSRNAAENLKLNTANFVEEYKPKQKNDEHFGEHVDQKKSLIPLKDVEPEVFIPRINNFFSEKDEVKLNNNDILNLSNETTKNFSKIEAECTNCEIGESACSTLSGENLDNTTFFEEQVTTSKNEQSLSKSFSNIDKKNCTANLEKIEQNANQLAFTDEIKENCVKYKLIGEIFSTYFIVEMNKNELLFIDKHAAHERLIYEKLKREHPGNYSQMLLAPVTVSLDKVEYDAVLNNSEVFGNAGFELDDFGVGTVIVRAAPMLLDSQDIKSIVSEMAGYLLEHHKKIASFYADWLYENIACRAAIKAGKPCSTEEMLALIKKLQAEPVHNCPHGRPIFVIIKKSELEKKFFRI